MRRIIPIATILLAVLACERRKTTVDTSAVTPPAAAINLADVAGSWNMRAMPMDRDTTLTTYTLMTTTDTAGWMMHFPGRTQPVALRVRTEGDSIVTEAGPYPSVLRRGVNVTTRTVYRLSGGRLTGTTEARYANADTVVRLRQEGSRAP